MVSLRRASGKTVVVDDHTTLAGGDTLVVSGTPAALALAEAKLIG